MTVYQIVENCSHLFSEQRKRFFLRAPKLLDLITNSFRRRCLFLPDLSFSYCLGSSQVFCFNNSSVISLTSKLINEPQRILYIAQPQRWLETNIWDCKVNSVSKPYGKILSLTSYIQICSNLSVWIIKHRLPVLFLQFQWNAYLKSNIRLLNSSPTCWKDQNFLIFTKLCNATHLKYLILHFFNSLSLDCL